MQTNTVSTVGTREAGPRPTQPPWLRLLPEDGWLTVLLLVAIVYTTIGSIQGVTPAWAPGLEILTATTGCGLLLGYLAVQQGRLPSTLVHLVGVVLGVTFAFQQTANAVLGGNRLALWEHTRAWFMRAILMHQSSNDNTVFLLFMAILSFLLAYISIWLVFRTRRPWLAALANGVVLLINLDKTDADKTRFYLVLFVLATLLLLVRFTLAEHMRQWRARGLRFSPDLGWDFIQAGAIFAVAVLLLAYLLPTGSANASILSYWNSPSNPWQSIQNEWQLIFNGANGGVGPGTVSFFGADLQLKGSVTLTNTQVLHYTLPNPGDDPHQYLITQTFDTYNGQNIWSASQTQVQSYAANGVQTPSTQQFRVNSYTITLDNPPGGHLFAPGDESASFTLPSNVYLSTQANMPTLWASVNPLQTGDKYVAQGYVSTATVQQLQVVPYPYQLTDPQIATTYPNGLLQEYLYSTPKDTISPVVLQAALDATRGTTNMYDAAVHLEDYLRTFTYSLKNPEPPAGQDAIAWFLHTRRGFCTFFASAMAIMGRALGMPTRIALGFTSGEYDSHSNSFIVRGTDAHAWTQVYFGQYGWINFEPTAHFDKFDRAQAGTGPGGPQPTAGPSGGKSVTPTPRGARLPGDLGGGGGGQVESPVRTLLLGTGLSLSLLIALLLLCAALFLAWWRALFRGLTPVTAAFARISRLGAWAGAPPNRSQTPEEYAERLGLVIPEEAPTLQRLSSLYARERWGGGLPPETASESSRLYEQARVAIMRVIAHRMRHAPRSVITRIRRFKRRSGESLTD